MREMKGVCKICSTRSELALSLIQLCYTLETRPKLALFLDDCDEAICRVAVCVAYGNSMLYSVPYLYHTGIVSS